MSTVHRTARKLYLPLEMALRILESTESLTDIITLALTAPVFNAVWITYKASILAAVVPRSIECYPEALQLYNRFQRLSRSRDEDAVTRCQRLRSAERVVTSVRDHYIEKYLWKENILRNYTMASRERQSFTRAFYYLWGIVLTTTRFSNTSFQDTPQIYPPPRWEDIIPVSEISTLMALMYDDRLGVIIRRAYGVYTTFNCLRFAEYDRWRRCCTRILRNDYFYHDCLNFWLRFPGINSIPYTIDTTDSTISLKLFVEVRSKLINISDEEFDTIIAAVQATYPGSGY